MNARTSDEVLRQAEVVAARREELSQTIAALAEKFDVKSRTSQAVSDLRASAGRQLRQPEGLLVATAAVGSVVAAICAIIYWRRSRS